MFNPVQNQHLANLSLLLFYKVSSLNLKTFQNLSRLFHCSIIKVLCCCSHQQQLLYHITAFEVCQQLFYLFFNLSIEALCFLPSLSDSFIILSSVPAFVNNFFYFFTKSPILEFFRMGNEEFQSIYPILML